MLVDFSIREDIGKLQPLQNKTVKIISCRNDYVSTAEMKMSHDNFGLVLVVCTEKNVNIKISVQI